eukprot:409275-Amorphochlora_amoeboformis.AAC.1
MVLYSYQLFNPSPLANGFPEGAFWGSEEGHTFENPVMRILLFYAYYLLSRFECTLSGTSFC